MRILNRRQRKILRIFRKTKRMIKNSLRKLKVSLLGFPAYCFYKLLTLTLHYTEIGREKIDALNVQGEKLIFCLWHDELFPLPNVKRQLDIVTVVSPSVDGSVLARVLEGLGLRTVRGSSTRKGMSALLGAVKLMKNENVHACITLDGPAGPRHKVKEGALFLAFHADAFIVPVRISIENGYCFNTWDKFKIPFPFSKIKVNFAPEYKFEADTLNTKNLEKERKKLQKILNTMLNTEEEV